MMKIDELKCSEMSAEARRQAWWERDICRGEAWPGEEEAREWDYGDELTEILATRFHQMEVLLGKEKTAPHLPKLLETAAIGGDDWREILEEFDPSSTPEWRATVIIDNGGLYGRYGVTPRHIEVERRSEWIDQLVSDLAELREVVKPEPSGVIARIINLAQSRYAIDRGKGEVDIVSLSILGGVSEGRIRNILSSEGALERSGSGVSAASAAAWLKGRKAFFPSIWSLPDDADPEPEGVDFKDEVLFVPVAADGSVFHPGLARSGRFTIGAKGTERQVEGFREALAALHRMATPRWRRPNHAGNWGIVAGRDWRRIEASRLEEMAKQAAASEGKEG